MRIRGERELVGRDAVFECTENGVSGRTADTGAGREVDHAAAAGKRKRPLPGDVFTGTVCRADVFDGHAGVAAGIDDVVGGVAEVSEVHVQEPGLTGNHASHADVGEKVQDVLLGGETRAVVTERNLYADHFGNRQ